MNQKIEITKYVLDATGHPSDDKDFKKAYKLFWFNTRKKETGGYRLTNLGYSCFKLADLKDYKITLPENIVWTNQLIIWLDNFIESPFYINQKEIYVFSEKIAVQLILFSGDIRKYGLSKAKSVAKKQQAEI